MRSPQTRLIAISDRRIIGIAEQLDQSLNALFGTEMRGSETGLWLQIGISSERRKVAISGIGSDDLLQVIREADAQICHRIEIKWFQTDNIGISVSFTRENSQPTMVIVDVDDRFLSSSIRDRSFLAIMKAIAPYTEVSAFEHFDEQTKHFYAIRETTLSNLENALASLGVEFSKRATEQDHYLRARQEEIDERLRHEREALNAEHLARITALEARATQLDEREAEIDASDNRAARRRLQKELRETLLKKMETFRLSKDTEEKRRPIQWVFWALLGITSLAIVYFAVNACLYPPSTPSWTPLLRISISLLSFASFAIYYIRWQDRWLQRHAREEFHHQRLNADLIRASWLVETALESSTADGVKIPNELLSKLAVGLFEEERATAGHARHPAEDALAMLLGTPRELKVDYPGGSATYAQKDLKRTARSDLKAPQVDE